MQAFSEAVIDLYEAAEHACVKSYPHEVVRIVRKLIDFDGAVLGLGEAFIDDLPNLTVDQSSVFDRDPAILLDYAGVAADDPVTTAFLRGLPAPLVFDCRNAYRQRGHHQLDRFTRRHDIASLLIFGNRPSASAVAKWLVLYRGIDRTFDASDAAYLLVLWPHLSRGLAVNRSRYLERQAGSEKNRAAALINRLGAIEMADPGFRSLLSVEWPACTANRVPAELMKSWQAGRDYVGQHIHVSIQGLQGYLLCQAARKSRFDLLTPSEAQVATEFATGASHKTIAKKLGVSDHTVRSHLAHTYVKLGIHSKAELANIVAARPGVGIKRSESA